MKAFRHHGVVIALYIALTLLMSWPVLPNMTTQVAGSGGDPWQTLWRFEYNWRLLQDAWNSPEPRGVQGVMNFVHNEFFGGGEPRLVNLAVWPWMWLHVLFGQPLAYNLVWLLSFVLSGYFMYLLTRWLIEQLSLQESSSGWLAHAPAFIAGLVYMFLPFHVAHAHGHFGAMQIQWFPLLALLLLLFLKKSSVKAALMLAVGIIVQAWSEHHYVLWFILFALLVLCIQWRDARRILATRGGRVASVFLGVLMLFFVVLPYIPTIKLGFSDAGELDLGEEQVIRYSADPFAYVMPAYFHPVWGRGVYELFGRHFSGNKIEATQFLGLIPLLLVLFFHQRLSRHYKRLWIVVGIAFFVVSLGPRLHLLGMLTSLPLPYDLIDRLPVFSAVRTIGRVGVLVGLALSVLVGGVLSMQLRRWSSAVMVTVLVLIEFLFVPFPLLPAALPAVYDAVRALPGRAVVEIPAATHYETASLSHYATLIHHKEVVGSIALERGRDQSYFTVIRSIPGLRQLLYIRTKDLLESRPDFFGQRLEETLANTFAWLDVRALIVHPDSLSKDDLGALRRALEKRLSLAPNIVDGVLLYDVSRLNSTAGDGVFMLGDDSGYGKDKTDIVFEQTQFEIDKATDITMINVTGVPQRVELSFIVASDSASLDIDTGMSLRTTFVPGGARQRVEFAADTERTVIRFIPRESGRVLLIDPAIRVLQLRQL